MYRRCTRDILAGPLGLAACWKVRMRRAARASIASRATLRRNLTVAVMCVALIAGCSAPSRTRNVAATASSTVSTSTTAPKATTTTIPRITYRVKRGDSLTTIAEHFHVSISAIVSRNHVADPDRLTEGETLLIPPATPVKLVINPAEGDAGQAFEFKLTGAVPSETITFEIDSAAGKYTGGQHTASADGTVTASYQSTLAGPGGAYNVTAIGNLGTTVRAGFLVAAPATTPHT